MRNTWWLTSIILFFSCELSTEVNETTVIPDRKWEYNNIVKFAINDIDTLAKHDLYIRIRHDKKYEFSNLFLKIHEHQGQQKDSSHRIEFTLAEKDGRWTGKNSGDLYMHEYLLKENFSFKDTATYYIEVEQNMRENPLSHIADVGIRLVNKKQNTR